MSIDRIRVNLTAGVAEALRVLAKAEQEAVYLTYAHNIAYSASLDAMFANMPGYLMRSTRA